MLAALGDQMLRIAGTRTDGTILWCVGPRTVETHIAPRINDAAADADRPAPSIVCSIPCWVTDDPGAGREFIAKILAVYAELPSYRAMLDIEGSPRARGPVVRRAASRRSATASPRSLRQGPPTSPRW